VIFTLGSSESRSRVIRYKHNPVPHSPVRSSETSVISLLLLLTSVTATNIKEFLQNKIENFTKLYGLRNNLKTDNYVVGTETIIRAGRPGARFPVRERDFSLLKSP
jgi:hypothetical protein